MTTPRQDEILEYLSRHDKLEVSSLSELLRVSPSTIRRDLKVMEHLGLVVRKHGLAQLPMPIQYELPYEQRAARQIKAKRSIAALAKSLIQPGQVVGLSGGTTATELARQLRPLENVSIVTNAVNIALELQGQPHKRVVVTGGTLNQNSYELVGDLVRQSLQSLHLDLAFLGVSGIEAQFGCSVADEPEAVVARAFQASSAQTIILADHTKIGQVTFARFCPLSGVDLLITDAGLTAAQQAILQAAGLKILIASN